MIALNTLIAYGSLAMAFKFLEANKISMIVTLNPIITFIFMGILATIEVSWIEPEILSIKGMIAAFLVIFGAIMAVAFSSNNKKKEVSQYFKKK